MEEVKPLDLKIFYRKPYNLETTVNFRVEDAIECEKQSNITMYKTDELILEEKKLNSNKLD